MAESEIPRIPKALVMAGLYSPLPEISGSLEYIFQLIIDGEVRTQRKSASYSLDDIEDIGIEFGAAMARAWRKRYELQNGRMYKESKKREIIPIKKLDDERFSALERGVNIGIGDKVLT